MVLFSCKHWLQTTIFLLVTTPHCVNNLKRFVEIWLEERTFVQLGPIIAMVGYGYYFNKQTLLASFSPYFLIFGWEQKLPTSICREVVAILELDDLNV